MSEKDWKEELVKQAVVQAIVELHEEIGLDKILLEAADAYKKGERDAEKIAEEIRKRHNL
jgi:AAA+ superfamily predicted ATPase